MSKFYKATVDLLQTVATQQCSTHEKLFINKYNILLIFEISFAKNIN